MRVYSWDRANGFIISEPPIEGQGALEAKGPSSTKSCAAQRVNENVHLLIPWEHSGSKAEEVLPLWSTIEAG